MSQSFDEGQEGADHEGVLEAEAEDGLHRNLVLLLLEAVVAEDVDGS